MKDEYKTKKQLIDELIELRQKISALDKSKEKQKDKHESLKEHENRYKALFDRSLYCVYLHDLEGNLFDANPTALKLFGYTKEELSRLNILELIPKEQIPIAVKRVEEIIKTGSQKKSFEYQVKNKNGEYIWLEIEGALIYRGGKPYAIQGLAKDITERKQAEETLKQKEKELKERVKDLEEFYDMAVGRELRMKQLKEENDDLKKELEKYKNQCLSSN